VTSEQEKIAPQQSTRGLCRACAYFCDEAAEIERGLPGLASLSSAHGASRADDGFCSFHDRYLRASASCASFAPKRPAPTRPEDRFVAQDGKR
jgi:hypothetical protein